jgi:hypothetical protein
MDAPNFDLRIVHLDNILPHEDQDEHRAWPLVGRIKQDGVLRNPPIVSAIAEGDPRFVILDGANRIFALNRLGLDYAIVQVVSYDEHVMQLGTWSHVISAIPCAWIVEMLDTIEDVHINRVDRVQSEALLARRESLFSITNREGQIFAAHSHYELHHERDILLQIVRSYKQFSILNRAVSKKFDEVRALFPDATALVVFPPFQPAEVIEAARTGAHLPAGITRHIIHGRALRVNYPLEKLRSEEMGDLDLRNAELREWLQSRAASKGIRFYAEPTYLFDE